MSIAFDVWSIIIYVLIVLGIILGVVQGFAKQIKFLFGFLGAIILAILIGKIVYELVKNMSLATTLNQQFETMFLNKGEPFTLVLAEDTFSDTLTLALGTLKLPTFLSNLIIKRVAWSASYEGLAMGIVLGDALGTLVWKAIIYVVLTVIIWIILHAIFKAILKVASFRGISVLDHLLGFAFGAIKLLLIVCLVFWGFSIICAASTTAATSMASFLPQDPGDGYFSIAWWLYNNNPLIAWLVNI